MIFTLLIDHKTDLDTYLRTLYILLPGGSNDMGLKVSVNYTMEDVVFSETSTLILKTLPF